MATATKTDRLTPKDVQRLFDDGYHRVEVLPDGVVREAPKNGDHRDDEVVRTLKTRRTWY
jgi:hypothetical protein